VTGCISDKERVYCAVRTEFSGVFAKLLKATISFITSVCPSVRMEQLSSHWTDFHEWYSTILWNLVETIQVSLISDRNNGTAHEGQYKFPIISRSVRLRMRNVADKSVEKINKHCTIDKFIFRKSCYLWHNVEKYCTARQVTDDNMAQVHCMLDN